jgi:hypothetical protein
MHDSRATVVHAALADLRFDLKTCLMHENARKRTILRHVKSKIMTIGFDLS